MYKYLIFKKVKSINLPFFLIKPNKAIFIKKIISKTTYIKIAYMFVMESYLIFRNWSKTCKLIRNLKISFGGLLM